MPSAIVKTFKSTHPDFFTKPQGLDEFGIVIPGRPKISLGLEEFNFCEILDGFRYKGKRVAYLPPYSTIEVNFHPRTYDCIHLMFHNGNANGVTYYATMHNVSRIPEEDIVNLRAKLTRLPGYVAAESGAWPRYTPTQQAAAIKEWNKCFHSDKIMAKKGEPRFVVNMFYESITFHNNNENEMPQRRDWSDNKRASKFFEENSPKCS